MMTGVADCDDLSRWASLWYNMYMKSECTECGKPLDKKPHEPCKRCKECARVAWEGHKE